MTSATRPRRVLIIVENLPVPFDTRVWNEPTALAAEGYEVSAPDRRRVMSGAGLERIRSELVWKHQAVKLLARRAATLASFVLALRLFRPFAPEERRAIEGLLGRRMVLL